MIHGRDVHFNPSLGFLMGGVLKSKGCLENPRIWGGGCYFGFSVFVCLEVTCFNGQMSLLALHLPGSVGAPYGMLGVELKLVSPRQISYSYIFSSLRNLRFNTSFIRFLSTACEQFLQHNKVT